MIDRLTVDRILDAANIVDVVSDFVTLRRAGANLKGLCPFHDDRTPSFMVSPSKNICKCFACGEGGTPVHFIMKHEQLTYPEALRYLAKKYHIEIHERELTDEEREQQSERESLFAVNQWALEWFQQQMYDTADGRAVGLAYFRQRGFRDDIIKKFQLGFCPDRRDDQWKAAKAAGFKEEHILTTGLVIRRDDGSVFDRFRNRVIFPIFTLSGKVVGFGGRVLAAATKGVNIKYQNSPESIIYSKKRELYGLYQARQAIVKADLCYLVEGYTDVMAMHQMGVENVVASSGTALTTEQIRTIHRFTDNITVIYDGDAAGIKASQRGIDMLLAEGMVVKLLLLPDGDDPDSFARKHTVEEYQRFLNEHQVDFLRFKTDLLLAEAKNDPILLSRLTDNIVQSIAVIPNDITRSLYVKDTAQTLGVDEKLLTKSVSDTRMRGTRRDVAESATVQQPQQQATSQLPASAESALPGRSEAEVSQSFLQKERLIVQMIVRHGEKIMCNVEDEEGKERPLTVVEYVAVTMADDGLQMRSPLHQRILSEAMEHICDEGFLASRYFINHPDLQLAKAATEMATDPETLSKIYSKNEELPAEEDKLLELMPRLMTDYKLAVVATQLERLRDAIRQPDTLRDKQRYMELMKQYQEVKQAQKVLARQAGDRVMM
ncbi:MAG: DNA primase [Bacteroidaceae bacterium]|nr:DNA primase [Bacteroidaceae bacterium]